MDAKRAAERFDQAAGSLCACIREALAPVALSAKQTAQEIRIRAGAPIALTCLGQTWFLGQRGELHNAPPQGPSVTKEDVADSVVVMCGHSVHSHQHEMQNGFITLRGGHRAGLGGTAVYSGGQISAIREIVSINLRIAREVCGAADPLMRAFENRLCGLLIAGAPASGKTTLLRDLARQLSGGGAGRYYRVAVVDERGEIGAVCDGVAQNNLGPCCDILNGYPKGEGILMAVRTISPQVVVCDEIGAGDEVEGILDGLNCGVKIVASAHAASVAELLRRPQILRLLERGAFERIALLGSGDAPGRVIDILEVGELLDQAGGNVPRRTMLVDDGYLHGVRLVRKGADN